MKAVRFLSLGIFFLFFCGACQAQSGTVSAQPKDSKQLGALEVAPAIVEVLLDKAKSKEVVLTYTNHSKQALSVDIFPIDFRQKDGVGALSFVGQESGSYSYSLSSYLSFDSRTLELSAGEAKDITVRVNDRADLSPGGHYAAVIARVVGRDGDTEETKVAPSISSLILLRKVGGERFNLSLRDSSYPSNNIVFSNPSRIQLTFRNEGNVHLVPYGRVEVKDMFGRLLFKGVINSSSFRVFPSAIRLIPVDLHQLDAWYLPISINTLSIKGEDSLKKTTFSYRESYLYVNPWTLGIAIFLAVVFFVKKYKR